MDNAAEKKAKLEVDIRKWIAENKRLMPVTSTTWEIMLKEVEEKEVPMVQFEKYDSEQHISTPFFKPFSKIIISK